MKAGQHIFQLLYNQLASFSGFPPEKGKEEESLVPFRLSHVMPQNACHPRGLGSWTRSRAPSFVWCNAMLLYCFSQWEKVCTLMHPEEYPQLKDFKRISYNHYTLLRACAKHYQLCMW